MGSAQKKLPAKQWRRRKDERPGEIVSAAFSMFVERGFSATRLDDVARRACVSKGTLYRYFDDKDALFRAVVHEMVGPEMARAEELVTQYVGPSTELIRRLVHLWWGTVGESHLCGMPKLIMGEAGNFPELANFLFDKVVRRGRRIFARALRRGIDSGELRPLNVNYGARILIAPLVFAAIWECSLRPYDSEPYDPRTFVDMHVDTFLAAYAVPTRRRRRA